MRIGFLASHQGSNMQAVLDACRNGSLRATPSVLVSNNRRAGALKRAASSGVAVHVINKTTHPEPAGRDLAICESLQQGKCDLVVLAGYLKMIGPQVLSAFEGRILNIHPSLLPRHGGQGMFGIRVHEAVIRAGDLFTGVSIHAVDGEYDTGRILAQTEIPVVEGDTPESLSSRVLDVEHSFLVATLGRIACGELDA